MIRALDNELQRFNKDQKGTDIVKKYADNRHNMEGDINEEEAEMEDFNDGDEDMNEMYGENDDGGFNEDDKIQVDLGIVKDEDEQKLDFEKRFNVLIPFCINMFLFNLLAWCGTQRPWSC